MDAEVAKLIGSYSEASSLGMYKKLLLLGYKEPEPEIPPEELDRQMRAQLQAFAMSTGVQLNPPSKGT